MHFIKDNNQASYQINSFEHTRIVINQKAYDNHVMIWPNKLLSPWDVANPQSLTEADFAPLQASSCKILILGTGQRLRLLAPVLLQLLYQKGIVVESMDSRAACHTYQVLSAEGRSVCGAILLLPEDKIIIE